MNVSNKGLTGKEMEELLEHVGITANKNAVPFDLESPFVTSGIRLGTPALSTRGMGTDEMRRIAGIIDRAVELDWLAENPVKAWPKIKPEEFMSNCSAVNWTFCFSHYLSN